MSEPEPKKRKTRRHTRKHFLPARAKDLVVGSGRKHKIILPTGPEEWQIADREVVDLPPGEYDGGMPPADEGVWRIADVAVVPMEEDGYGGGGPPPAEPREWQIADVEIGPGEEGGYGGSGTPEEKPPEDWQIADVEVLEAREDGYGGGGAPPATDEPKAWQIADVEVASGPIEAFGGSGAEPPAEAKPPPRDATWKIAETQVTAAQE